MRAWLLEEEDPRLRYLYGRLLVAAGKEVEGSQEIEAALAELEAGEGGLEEVLAELEHPLSGEEDEADPGPDA